jgi:hypothetical protein
MGRRQRWSEDERRALLAACAQSGLSVKAFAAAADVPYTTIVYWKRRSAAETGARFVPVEIERRADATIDVMVGGAVVRVGADFDESLLVRVVRALRACGSCRRRCGSIWPRARRTCAWASTG